jgi:hypothetical protein
MKLESSNVESSGADASLTPSFTKRSLQTIARVQDGQTAVVAGIKQENKGDSRAGIPVISMLPLVGRLFSTPQQNSSLTDIIITVTPHIIRTAEIKQADHLVHLGGVGNAGLSMTIEDVVMRAQAEDDQDRRIIAMEQKQLAQPNTVPGMPAGATLASAAQISETTAPQLGPVPKVDAPSFAPPPTTGNAATIASRGLTPPPTATAFQAESATNNSTTTPLRNASLTNTAPPSNGTNAGNSVQSTSPIPVGSTSISEVVNSANTNPTVKSQSTASTNQGGASSMRVVPVNQTGQTTGNVTQPGNAQEKEWMSLSRNSGGSANSAEGQATAKPPEEFVPPTIEGPKEPVAPAAIKMRPTLKMPDEATAGNARGAAGATAKPTGANRSTDPAGGKAKGEEANAAVELNLLCQPKQQVGKSFLVVVSVNGEAQITGANISLKYDPALLQLKAVRDGGLLGSQADITHQDSGGSLVITVQQGSDKTPPVKATGKLVVVEFTALGPGETSIDFNNAETQFTLTDSAAPQVNAVPVKLEISREAISKLNK